MLLRRLHYLLRRNRFDRELAEELEGHRLMVEERLGSVDASRRVMGNVTLAREDASGIWMWSWLDSAAQDVRYALRNLRRQPGFALLAIMTLGTAIGVNTSLLTVFSTFFLRPWPVADPSAVFELSITVGERSPFRMEEFSLREYRHLREHTRSLSGLIASACADDRQPGCRVKLDEQTVGALFVSRDYFDVLGIPMERGPGLSGPEEGPSAVAVISYTLWQERFAGDSAIIGRTIRLNDAELTVMGVAPPSFTGTSFARKELWLPIAARALIHPHAPAVSAVRLAGRLRSDVTRQTAAAELESLSRRFRSESVAGGRDDIFFQPGRISLASTSFNPNPGKTQQGFAMFAVLALGTLLVLILACANVGNLLLARSAARGRELAVRMSLGAGRQRLLRQLLTESLVLAIAAAVLGWSMSLVLPPPFVNWIYTQFRGIGTPPFPVAPDARVIAWTAVLVVVTCVAFGLAPALHAVRASVAGTLKGDTGVRSRLRLRSVLLAIQVVVSVVLLAGAALLVRSVRHAATFDLGFVADNVAVVSLDSPPSYDAPARTALAHQVMDALADLLQTKSVAVTTTVPFGAEPERVRFRIPGETAVGDRLAEAPEVSARYFEVLGIPTIAGRLLDPADAGRDVIVVDEGLAASLWPGESPLGRHLLIEGTPFEIVAVVKDADTGGRFLRARDARAIQARSDDRQISGTIYRQLRRASFSSGNLPYLLVHAGTASTASLAKQLKRVDARVDVQVRPLRDNIDRQLSGSRMGAFVAGVLGLLAVTFASIGVFGVFAYIVQQRTREIGVRMALGARPLQVIRFILRSSSPALLIGLVLGFGAAIAGSRIIESSLVGISALDPLAYAAVVAILTCAALFAVLVPTWRATRVDPVSALRCE